MRGTERVLRGSAQRGNGDVTLLRGICVQCVISPCLTSSYTHLKPYISCQETREDCIIA